jgi:hypothetical protein
MRTWSSARHPSWCAAVLPFGNLVLLLLLLLLVLVLLLLLLPLAYTMACCQRPKENLGQCVLPFLLYCLAARLLTTHCFCYNA